MQFEKVDQFGFQRQYLHLFRQLKHYKMIKNKKAKI